MPRQSRKQGAGNLKRYDLVEADNGSELPSQAEFDASLHLDIQNNANPQKFLRFQQKLGQGGGGIVYRVKDCRDGVVKAIKIAHSMDLDELKTEIALHELSSNGHCNMVHFEESFKVEDSIWILMELCDYGSLFDLIDVCEQRWEENLIGYVVVQCLQALSFMHDKLKLMHRDLKSDNIFLTKSGCVKVADFGWSCGKTKEKAFRREAVGTPHWMPPEVILQQEYDERCDIWSMGIVAIEMAEAQPPFMDKTHGRAQLLIASQQERSGLSMPYERSEELSDFLRQCLHKDFRQRPSAKNLLLKSSFLNNKTAGKRKDLKAFLKQNKR